MKLRRVLYATALFGYSAIVISSDAPAWMRVAGRVLHWMLRDVVGVCDGTADDVDIQAAIDALSDGIGGDIYLSDGRYYVNATISFWPAVSTGERINLILSRGATIVPTANVDIFKVGRKCRISGGRVDCSSLASWNSAVFFLDGAWHFDIGVCLISDMDLIGLEGLNHGKAFYFYCDANGEYIMNVTVRDVSIWFFTYGVHMYSNVPGGSHAWMNDNTFEQLSYVWATVYGFYQEILGAGMTDMARNNIYGLKIECGSDTLRGLRIEGVRSEIRASILDVGFPTGAFYSYELTSKSSNIQLSGEFAIHYGIDNGTLNSLNDTYHPKLSPTLFDNLLVLPTNAGWTASHVGGGGAQEPSRLYVNTSVAINSRGMLYCSVMGLRPNDNDLSYIDWDKKLYFSFSLARIASDAEVTARIQLKQVNTEGALAAKGMGIRLDNLTLMGESYGASIDAVNLATAFTSTYPYRILIVHYPVTRIEWYVNGVLKGTQAAVAKIPSGDAGAASTCVASIINGGTGGVDAYLHLLRPIIWQEE